MNTQTVNPLPPSAPTPRGSARPLNIILAVIGALALLTMLIGTTRGAVASLSSSHVVKTADAMGLTALDVRADFGSFTLQFTDTTEAVLEVHSTSGSDWTLERSGTELRVRPPAGWGNWCFFGCTDRANEITLSLPRSLNDGSLDTKLALSAGELIADGDFKSLDLNISAGQLLLNGSASTVQAELGAGRADITLDEVDTADLRISAGRMDAELTGSAPSRVTANVSAGNMVLTLPNEVYAVRSNSSAGSVENRLQTSSNSEHEVEVELSAGSAVLRPASN